MEEITYAETPDKDYKCLDELKKFRGYIPASIDLKAYPSLDYKLDQQCKGCVLRKELGFCAIRDELIEIRDRAVDAQSHTVFRPRPSWFGGLMGYSTNRTSGMTNPMRTNRRHW